MKRLLIGLLCLANASSAQELYVFSEPASNMPARSFGLKYSGKSLYSDLRLRREHRQTLELQFGHGKKWMSHISGTLSNMYSPGTRMESIRIYSKYRLLSLDQVHKHFRAAVFGEWSHSVNAPMFDELSLEGDQSGARGGLILTQLLHKLALSTTVSYLNSFQARIRHPGHTYNYNTLQYSLSAGYLLFPKTYNNYKQTNLNLYLEVLGNRAIDKKTRFLDLAPALQLIFSSNTKVNLGYRFQVNGDMARMARQSFHISVERTFLNALKRRL